jgi:predicted NBD/HSP70 family sugar kinase
MCCAIISDSDETQMAAVLGIDVGGSKILAQAGEGASVWSRRIGNSRLCSPAVLIETLLSLVGDATAAGHEIEALGLGFPGLVDGNRGLVRSSVILDGWRDVPFAGLLEARLGIPVAIDNDVNCYAWRRSRFAPPQRRLRFCWSASGLGLVEPLSWTAVSIAERRAWRVK